MEGFGLVMEEGLHLAMTEESQSLFFFCHFDFSWSTYIHGL